MATVTPGKVFTANEIVTPTNLNALGVPTVSNIVTADMNPSVALVPTGAIMPFAMNSAPSGWLAADGAVVSRTTYATLFAAIGTTYGAGNGTTTFALPDLQGYFVRGAGTNPDGTAAGAFGAKQSDAVIAHTHGTGNQSQNHSHPIAADVSANTSVEIIAGQYLAATNTNFNERYVLAGTATVPTLGLTGSNNQDHTHTTNSQTPTGAAETRPKNIALLYCIKA